MELDDKRLVVVSNRLPIAIFEDGEGGWKVKPGTGGLVTALQPIVNRSKGMWIGWPGCSSEVPFEQLLRAYSLDATFEMIPVAITEREIAKYYRGFCNKAIWPLFHDLLGQFSFDLEDYHVYNEVNRRFAECIAEHNADDDVIWIHDYQLLLVGHYLREIGVKSQLNFFLHIPFPSIDLFRRFPRNAELIKAIMCYDHIGFQTAMDRRNFISCLKWLVPETKRLTGKRRVIMRYQGREIAIGYYPISIDFNEFNDGAKLREVADAAWFLRENISVEFLALGLDRLDYTKGIPERFLAFERLLEKYPDTNEKISLLQVVVPSRLNVSEYQDLKRQLDFLAGRINARFSRHGWVPIHYLFRTLERDELLGHYKAADIGLITPLRDGMNLVSKEYCAASFDNKGILILSEFAGAAPQLAKGALMVNPYDFDSTADALYEAIKMPPEEIQRRMKAMRADVKRNDVYRWVRWFFASE